MWSGIKSLDRLQSAALAADPRDLSVSFEELSQLQNEIVHKIRQIEKKEPMEITKETPIVFTEYWADDKYGTVMQITQGWPDNHQEIHLTTQNARRVIKELTNWLDVVTNVKKVVRLRERRLREMKDALNKEVIDND